MRSTVSIDVAAPPELVFRLARDVTRWPRLLPHYIAVRVQDRGPDGAVTASMIARRPFIPILGIGLPVAWRSRVTVDPMSFGLHFRHLGGATAGMEVAWRLESTPGGCRVSIEHDFQRRLAIPLIGARLGDDAWPRFIDRWFTRPIATRTLATFKALAESLVPDADDEARGDTPTPVSGER